MALTGHQVEILRAIWEGCNETAHYNPSEGEVNGFLKKAGVATIGRKYLNIYFTTSYTYDFSFFVDSTFDEVLKKVDEEVCNAPKVPRMKHSVPISAIPETIVMPIAHTEPAAIPAIPEEVNEEVNIAIPEMPPAPPAAKGSFANYPLGFYIPSVNKTFVPFGEMLTVDTIVKSGAFLPTYIYGDTGIAKSMSVVQSCAKHKREVFRVNVNINTDEEDFIGGFRLVDNATVFEKGPLVLAMERGAILLIDEISALNPANAFALFSVLEGGELYIKKTNERIAPAPGFNVIVTDNTKGKGSTSGRFVGTNVQNDALLDRFVVSLKYDYPNPSQELKILNAVDSTDKERNKNLIKWANIVRTSFNDGIIDETISVRKLVSILNICKVFGDMKRSIEMALNRYEEETRKSILDLFEKIVVDPAYNDMNFDNTDVEIAEGAE